MVSEGKGGTTDRLTKKHNCYPYCFAPKIRSLPPHMNSIPPRWQLPQIIVSLWNPSLTFLYLPTAPKTSLNKQVLIHILRNNNVPWLLKISGSPRIKLIYTFFVQCRTVSPHRTSSLILISSLMLYVTQNGKVILGTVDLKKNPLLQSKFVFDQINQGILSEKLPYNVILFFYGINYIELDTFWVKFCLSRILVGKHLIF